MSYASATRIGPSPILMRPSVALRHDYADATSAKQVVAPAELYELRVAGEMKSDASEQMSFSGAVHGWLLSSFFALASALGLGVFSVLYDDTASKAGAALLLLIAAACAVFWMERAELERDRQSQP